MNLAYHYVAGGSDALQRVLLDGKLTPAIDRMDLLASRLRCGDFMATAGARERVHPFSFDSLGDLLEERLDEIDPSDFPEASRTRSETQFHCVDLLAGDLENIFLSLREWPEWLQDPENGFAFDAEQLVRKGARVRPFDLIDDYEAGIWEALQKDRGQDVDDLKAVFRRVQKKNEFRGRKALEFVRSKSRGELVWKGDLPVNWSDEIWREGQLEWSRT